MKTDVKTKRMNRDDDVTTQHDRFLQPLFIDVASALLTHKNGAKKAAVLELWDLWLTESAQRTGWRGLMYGSRLRDDFCMLGAHHGHFGRGERSTLRHAHHWVDTANTCFLKQHASSVINGIFYVYFFWSI